jgi:DHA1 family multidrug resistance protein-like MFS transporter
MMLIPIVPLFIPILMPNINLLNTFTGLVVGVTSATTTLSAIYLGRLGDRIGYRRIVVISAFGAALLYYLQSLVTTGWHLLVLQALVGVSMGGIIPAISALLARLTRAGEEGAVYGLDNSINAAGRWVAPLLSTGVAVQFNLRATFVATAVLFLITGLLAAWRLPQVSRTKQQTEKPAP